MSTAPAAVSAGRASKRAPRPPAAVIARRLVARLTMPVLLLLPAMVIIVGLIGYPLVRTVYLSFTDTGLGELIYGGSTWVGLDNFKEVFSDEHLRASLVNTVVFGTLCVIGTMVFGFAIALLLNQRLRGNCVLLDRRAAAVGGAGDRRERDLQVAVRLALRVRQLGAGGARLRLLPGLRVVRRALQRVRGDLHHGRLAVVPVHRAVAAGRAADDPEGDCCTPPPSTAPARGTASGW